MQSCLLTLSAAPIAAEKGEASTNAAMGLAISRDEVPDYQRSRLPRLATANSEVGSSPFLKQKRLAKLCIF